MALLIAPIVIGCGGSAAQPDNAILVGALLPFTGGASATGSNVERALIQMAEEINAAGGIDGRAIRIEARDTHSDVDRGLEAAKELMAEGALGIIGPQDGALARALLPTIGLNNVVTISPGIGLPPFQTFAGGGYFFRIGPSVGDFANVLATQMAMDGVTRIAVVSMEDDFDTTFGVLSAQQFSTFGGQQVASFSISASQQTFDAGIRAVSIGEPQAILLSAPADIAASFAQSWVATQSPIRFYVPPPLKTDVFVKNTPPGALEHATGVAPTVSADAAAFAASFVRRWDGDVPSPEAHYARDALALFALAAQAASHASGGTLSGLAIRDQVASVSYSPGGEVVRWNEIGRALELVRSGAAIDFRGTSGDVDIKSGFIVPGPIGIWSISGNQMVDIGEMISMFCRTIFTC